MQERKIVDLAQVVENADHALVNYMKRMIAAVMSISERKEAVLKSERHLVTQNLALIPQFALQDGGLMAMNYCFGNLACNSNKSISIVLLSIVRRRPNRIPGSYLESTLYSSRVYCSLIQELEVVIGRYIHSI